jgi:carbamoyltransferase
VLAVQRCLELAGLAAEDVDVIAVGWDEPRLSAQQGRPWGVWSPGVLVDQLGLKSSRSAPDVVFVPHHRAHAISAFCASPYEEAAILVVDGQGEDESISIFRARRGQPLVRLHSWARTYSLGFLYEETNKWLGLRRLDAGKTMGLAAYGRDGASIPAWFDIDAGQLISAAGSDPKLDYEEIRAFWRAKIARFAGVPGTSSTVEGLAKDVLSVKVAWSAQANVEFIMGWLADTARRLAGMPQLCIAGGVGLNCAANGRLSGPIYVPPVPHDAGVALGAAWSLVPPRTTKIFSAYTGPSPGEPQERLEEFTVRELNVDVVADLLLRGRVGAICRGRSEVGPRALCHRSILASPLTEDMRDRVNRIKRREPWRPFGPVSNADAGLWEPIGELERYMVGAASVTELGSRSLRAIRHVDGTTRPQRLTADDEPFVDALLTTLSRLGHPPALLNTSFNGPGQPIVETATEAVAGARNLGLDFLVLNDDLLLPRRGFEQSSNAHSGDPGGGRVMNGQEDGR